MNGSRCEINKIKGYFVFLLFIVMTIASFFILLPLAYHLFSKWIIPKTYIDNQRLIYRGKVIEIYKKFFIAIIFTIVAVVGANMALYYLDKWNIISLTIASNTIITFLATFFITRAMKIYVHKHTHFVNSKYKDSTYTFHPFLMIITKFAVFILNTITGYFLFPVTTGLNDKYDANRKLIDGYSFVYKARYRGYILKWILTVILCIITFGLYIPKAYLDVYCWSAENIHLRNK